MRIKTAMAELTCSGCPIYGSTRLAGTQQSERSLWLLVCLLLLTCRCRCRCCCCCYVTGVDTDTSAAGGDTFQQGQKTQTNFTCPPGTYITGFPTYVDSTTRRLVGIKQIDCSNSDQSASDSSTGKAWGLQSGDKVSYTLPNGFSRARVESERGAGIHSLVLRRADFKPTANNPNRYVIEDELNDGPLATSPTTQPWNVSNENCANGNVAAGVYIRHSANKTFTMGLVCRKGESKGT